MRNGADGEDQLLVDPAHRDTGKYTAVKPLRVSPDGRLLLYEVKEGGERTGIFELLEIDTRKRLPDLLPRGYLRGFAFAPDGKSFYYVHEAVDGQRPFYRAAYKHTLGKTHGEDEQIFFAGEDEKIRLCLCSDETRIGFLVYRFGERVKTSFTIQLSTLAEKPVCLIEDTEHVFGPLLFANRIFAITNKDATNFRIVEIAQANGGEIRWIEIVPEISARVERWVIAGDRLVVSYVNRTSTQVAFYDFGGQKLGDLPVQQDETIRLLGSPPSSGELIYESESFTRPPTIHRYLTWSGKIQGWARGDSPFNSANYKHIQVWYPSKDGTQIPMFLVGHRDVLESGEKPIVMTSYGGFGTSVRPQFSVFASLFLEKGCIFALPNIRGGCEFGTEWHVAAKRLNRQTAFDDFLSAAEWLIATGRTSRERLAIFGGSNSGLLVGAALTQRPDLFRAVVCMVPMLDMLRYHLFDNAHVWKDEFGTADDPRDFSNLSKYSPYHNVRMGVVYPATMFVSGDADRNCNPLHARKMTAQLQAANNSDNPVFLDYNQFRGHSPTLPLSERIQALTDRVAFVCQQLQLPV